MTYEGEEDSDSDEENQENEDEKENARNRLIALLGGSSKNEKKSKPSRNQQAHWINSSQDQNENESNRPDFLYEIEKMRNDLYYKLKIWTPEEDEDEDDVEVSKIFYEGREGQKYTVRVLDKFFSTLKKQVMNFAQQFGIEDEKSVQNKAERRKKVNKNIFF